MDFPCEFTMKVIGAVEANLEDIVKPALIKNNIDITHAQIATRLSSGGKYSALTVTFNTESQEQLDEIYREISGNPQVQMVL